MAQKANAQATETQQAATDEVRKAQGAETAERGRETGRDTHQDETRQMEEAAHRIGGAARESGQSGAEALRETGELVEQRARESGHTAERQLQEAGQRARESAEKTGERSRQIADFSADQFDRMGEMMADAARDAAETARIFMRFGGFQTGGARNMQLAAGGLMDRMLQTQMEMMQRMMGQADAVQFATAQQRLFRRFLENWTEGSAELLRATRQSVDQALDVLDSQHSEAGRSGGGRRQGRGQQVRGRQVRVQDRGRDQQEQTVGDLMHRGLRTVGPDQTIKDAAAILAEEDIGVLPVLDGDKLVGMITDRDIAIRLAADGKEPGKAKVREAMSGDVVTCREDDGADDVLDRMAEEQLHRLPVLDDKDRPVGIVSLADLVNRMPEQAGQALRGIDKRGGRHSQTTGA